MFYRVTDVEAVMPSSTKNVSEKALMLLAEGRVVPVEPPVREFRVDSDSERVYRVRVYRGGYCSCSCRAHGPCKHLEAARVFANASRDERLVLDAALTLRRERESSWT
jgi:hypothetical protein